jgi:altronate hydrolase
MNLLHEIKQRNPSFKKPVLIFEQQQSQSEESLIIQAIQANFFRINGN